MKSRKLHKLIGLILVLPMLGWTFTGLVFFIKPGYQGAYEQLSVKTYPLSGPITIIPQDNWQEVRVVKTVLGEHLIVKANNKSQHLDPTTLLAMPEPTTLQLETLINDAFTDNQARYGDIISTDGFTAKTNTGVEVVLNWSSLRLSQQGQDTQLINLLYQVHYLQWTPFKELNQVVGIFGLILLISLTVLGVRIYLKQRV
ncbi:PepSY domain-containing protein [Colwellia sp. 6M3]|uniref:PepSY domain-containing protein n=1 Tax=Colwellia sp. 6M3 TaxID=2759849 RepID=UPI0015F40949|nr:PepSY domain-containing protein [Colwellia sp. 6M3]MBA6416867.1 PepSY domain-containing protein [Colwellia sp. 6M3]